jgi:hypothetical protein
MMTKEESKKLKLGDRVGYLHDASEPPIDLGTVLANNIHAVQGDEFQFTVFDGVENSEITAVNTRSAAEQYATRYDHNGVRGWVVARVTDPAGCQTLFAFDHTGQFEYETARQFVTY